MVICLYFDFPGGGGILFVPRDAIFSDDGRPQPIGFRATISAPHMHAHALEVLSPAIPAEGGRVLDVGCGSGYLTGVYVRKNSDFYK